MLCAPFANCQPLFLLAGGCVHRGLVYGTKRRQTINHASPPGKASFSVAESHFCTLTFVYFFTIRRGIVHAPLFTSQLPQGHILDEPCMPLHDPSHLNSMNPASNVHFFTFAPPFA
jgi:hypothetical protein